MRWFWGLYQYNLLYRFVHKRTSHIFRYEPSLSSHQSVFADGGKRSAILAMHWREMMHLAFALLGKTS